MATRERKGKSVRRGAFGAVRRGNPGMQGVPREWLVQTNVRARIAYDAPCYI